MYDLMIRDFDKSFNRFFDNFPTKRKYTDYNVKSDEASYSLSVEVPGIPPESLEVSVEGGYLVVGGKVSAEDSFDGTERTFKKSWKLGEDIDTEDVEAKLEHGILLLTLPKTATKTSKQIPVMSS